MEAGSLWPNYATQIGAGFLNIQKLVSRGWPLHVMGVPCWWSHHHYWTWAPPVADTLTTTGRRTL